MTRKTFGAMMRLHYLANNEENDMMDVNAEADEAVEMIDNLPAMSPGHATAAESLDFLQAVRNGISDRIEALTLEVES